jgi:hypothetical protein
MAESDGIQIVIRAEGSDALRSLEKLRNALRDIDKSDCDPSEAPINRLFTLRARPSQERGRRRLPACLRDGPRGDCVGDLARATLRPLDRLAHVKNPKARVVKPEGEEEWGTEKWR